MLVVQFQVLQANVVEMGEASCPSVSLHEEREEPSGPDCLLLALGKLADSWHLAEWLARPKPEQNDRLLHHKLRSNRPAFRLLQSAAYDLIFPLGLTSTGENTAFCNSVIDCKVAEKGHQDFASRPVGSPGLELSWDSIERVRTDQKSIDRPMHNADMLARGRRSVNSMKSDWKVKSFTY